MDQPPFIGISITCDYHCNVYNNINNFSYSFFVWCGADGKFNIDLFHLYYLCYILLNYLD
jgi:hypothetical protein